MMGNFKLNEKEILKIEDFLEKIKSRAYDRGLTRQDLGGYYTDILDLLSDVKDDAIEFGDCGVDIKLGDISDKLKNLCEIIDCRISDVKYGVLGKDCCIFIEKLCNNHYKDERKKVKERYERFDNWVQNKLKAYE